MNKRYRYSSLGILFFIASCSSSDLVFVDSDNPIGNATEGSAQENITDPSILPRADVRDISEIYPYRPNSPYATVLRECALVAQPENACTLASLPFLAQENQTVTRDDIMNRLLVTHPWMGERFESLLNNAPENLIPLFGSITSIVIGSTVRPSYYWAGTGAIHLDPAGLWLSVEEKSNVAVAEDFRADFADDLQFWFFESMRLGNEGVGKYYSLTDREEIRLYDDIRLPIYRLLYHELAHAMDYLPPQSVPTLNASVVPGAALIANENFFLSPQLTADIPLNSQALHAIGRVSFQGDTATSLEESYTPNFLGIEMEGDGSAKLYAYASIREDFSTAFTMAMMKLNFDVDLYTAFVNKPADLDNYDCGDLLVGWGQKNRLADPLVSARAKWAVESVYGISTELTNFFATELGQAQPMVVGVNWCANRDGTVLADPRDAANVSTTVSSDSRKSVLQQLTYERQSSIH